MVEVVEHLCHLERELGYVRRLSRRNRALHGCLHFGYGKQHLPEIFALQLSAHSFRRKLRGETRNGLSLLLEFAQDIARAHRRILDIWSGLAFEAQGLLKIESDHG